MIQFNLVRYRPGFIFLLYIKTNFQQYRKKNHNIGISPERRCSSRTFRYGYLVTT